MKHEAEKQIFQVKLGKKLRDLRKKRYLTQQQMAEFLSLNRSTYTYYETGDSQPNLQTLVKIADFFGVTTDYLLRE